MLEPYGHTAGVVSASDGDKTPLVWQQRLAASPDALQNNVDMQGHANSLSQVRLHMVENVNVIMLLLKK